MCHFWALTHFYPQPEVLRAQWENGNHTIIIIIIRNSYIAPNPTRLTQSTSQFKTRMDIRINTCIHQTIQRQQQAQANMHTSRNNKCNPDMQCSNTRTMETSHDCKSNTKSFTKTHTHKTNKKQQQLLCITSMYNFYSIYVYVLLLCQCYCTRNVWWCRVRSSLSHQIFTPTIKRQCYNKQKLG